MRAIAVMTLSMFLATNSAMAQGSVAVPEDCAFSKPRFFPGKIKVFNIGPTVNTEFSEYNSVFNADESFMLFTSRNDSTTGERMYAVDLKPYEDISISNFEQGRYRNATNLSEKEDMFPYAINSAKHEAPVHLAMHDSLFIIFKQDKLWYSVLCDTGYCKAMPMPKEINIGPYQRHASVTADGKTIYFSSETSAKVDGRFRYDIFMSTKDGEGKWQNPVRLPDKINTPYDEDSPMISADGKSMYYSSTRPGGLGGYDIYYTELVNGEWSDPVNLCEPINSPAHDIYFSVLKNGEYAYMSSNRLGGYGNFDIYKVVLNPPEFDACVPLAKGEPVHFDAADYVDIDIANPVYLWDFGDGSTGKGAEVDHIYKRPGTYAVKLRAEDKVKGTRYDYKLDKAIEVKFSSGGAFIYGPDTVGVDEQYWYDAATTRINGRIADYYYWRVSDDVMHGVDRIKLKWAQPGSKKVSLDAVQFSDDNLSAEHQCVTKDVEVLETEAYEAYLERAGYAKNAGDLIDANETALSKLDPRSREGLIASNDKLNTLINTAVTVHPIENDIHTEGQVVSLENVATPLYGSIRREGSTVIYTPKADFTGTDRFSYFVKSNDGEAASAYVIIEVKSEEQYTKDATVANDFYVVRPGETVEMDVMSNDVHPEGLKQNVIGMSEPKHGTANVTDLASGKISYSAGMDYDGKDAFVYTVRDEDGFINSAVVHLKVGNDVPVETFMDIKSTRVSEPVVAELFANDVYEESTSIALESVSKPQNGFIKILNREEGTIAYHPNPGFIGTDASTYTVKSGNFEQTEGVMFIVGSPQDVQSLKPQPDVASTETGKAVELELLANDANLTGEEIKLIRLQEPAHGTMEILDRKTGLVRYTPNEEFAGTEVLSYSIKDRRALEASSSVTITVSGAPEVAYGMALVNDVHETSMNVPVVIAPLENDKHLKGRYMRLHSITDPEKGSASIDNVHQGLVYYAPAEDFVGEDHFIYEVVDSRGAKTRAQITVRVLPQFDANRVDLTQVPELTLEPIFFDYDKDEVRKSEIATIDKNIEILKQNPDAVIKVVSHCDSRGRTSYNYQLSTRRAMKTVEYLKENGISESRIIAVLGMGESELKNDCGDGVDCPDSDHQQNRRSEFIVIGTLR